MENSPQVPQEVKIDHTDAVEAPALTSEVATDRKVSIWRKAFNKLGIFGMGAAVGAGAALGVGEAISNDKIEQTPHTEVGSMNPNVAPGSEIPGMLAPGAQPAPPVAPLESIGGGVNTGTIANPDDPAVYNLNPGPAEVYTIPSELPPLPSFEEATAVEGTPPVPPSLPEKDPSADINVNPALPEHIKMDSAQIGGNMTPEKPPIGYDAPTPNIAEFNDPQR